ncbi:MAG: RNA polymerase sigma factor [Candidatus Kapaibacterium sp.]
MRTDYGKYEDQELFLELKGDKSKAEAAFAEIYARYSQRIYAYCLRVTGHPEEARDIFQETFLKFYSAAQERKSMENLPAYLLAIARNLCINYKRNSKINLTFEDYRYYVHDTGYEQKEMLDLIARALETLEFEYREAFILRQYHGLSYKEICQITGDSLSAIKNRVWRAKEKIKEILQPYMQDMS